MEPAGIDDLGPVAPGSLELGEAPPMPAQGAERDMLVAATEARAEAAEGAFTAVLSNHLARMQGVTLQRMGGPKARRGTKWWRGDQVEVKAVDPGQVLPDRLVAEVEDALRPVALRVAQDAAADAARRLGVDPEPSGDGMFAVNQQALMGAVEDAVSEILGVTQRQAEDVRAAILEADKDADDLDEVLDRIEAAYRKGGNWVLMSGRTLANALANEAAMIQAKALGVTHAQWLSKRDVRVRPTHRVADGQVREIGDRFRVGLFRLRFPGDPTDLPDSWEEVANCRCGLLFAKPDAERQRVMRQLDEMTKRVDGLTEAARQLLAAGAATPQVMTSGPVVGFRALPESPEPTPGQRITLQDDLALSLLAPVAWTAAAPVLSVLIGTGVAVTVTNGAVVLPVDTTLEVVAASVTGVQAYVANGAATPESTPPPR
jgi:hypothetical protein